VNKKNYTKNLKNIIFPSLDDELVGATPNVGGTQ